MWKHRRTRDYFDIIDDECKDLFLLVYMHDWSQKVLYIFIVLDYLANIIFFRLNVYITSLLSENSKPYLLFFICYSVLGRY